MDLEHRTEGFVNASWSMVDLRDLIYDMLGLLFTELSQHGGMAGDDGAGRAFATVYKPAVATVFASAGHAHQAMANGAGTLLKAAEDFIRQDNAIAAALLDQSPAAPAIGSQPSGPDCNPRASHKAEDLPEVVGETSWTDQYLLDKRFHGQRDKLRKTAMVWNSAAKILEDAYWDSETAWKAATTHQQGETATAVEGFFRLFVGKTPPPSEVGEEETLMANLPTACRMIANACEAYADHVETASKRIPEESNPITGDTLLPWDRPRLGGDGHDGGLHELVSGDMRIPSLGKIPPAMDSSQARVPMPQPEGGGFLPPLPPFLAPLIRVPLLVPVAYRPANGPRVQPVPPPAPPSPRFPPLIGPQQQNFQTWLNSLRAGDVSGGTGAAVAYQLRVSGYPEYEVPIPPGISANSTLMVDGFRNSDGMAVEAKYVNKPNQPCYRSLDELRANHQTGKKDFLYYKDREELTKYAAALADPRKHGDARSRDRHEQQRLRRLLARDDGRLRSQGLRPPRPLIHLAMSRSTCVNPSDLAELRTMYVFSPVDGETWGLTFEGFRSHLLARNPDEFLRVDEGRSGPVRGSTLHFGITFDDEVLEGFAALTPEGVAITDCTAHAAANFVVWLRDEAVPPDKAITFNTEWGIEGDVPDESVPEVTRPRLVAAFLSHLESLGLG